MATKDDSTGGWVAIGTVGVFSVLAAALSGSSSATERSQPAPIAPPSPLPTPSPPLPLTGPPNGIGRPLRGPPRKISHHGEYHAPRWTIGGDKTKTTGTDPKDGSPIDHYHQGVDLEAQPGEPVLAIGDGKLVTFTPGACGIGARLVLDGFASAAIQYCDLGSVAVKPGDRVRRGDTIGRVGGGGFVHVAVNLSGHYVDPHSFLKL